MANNKAFKVKNGFKAPVFYENLGTTSSGTETQYYQLAKDNTGFTSYNANEVITNGGFTLSTDGDKMFMGDQSAGSTDYVRSYSLTTEWDITSASYDGDTDGRLNVNNQQGAIECVLFKPDGLKLFIGGSAGTGSYNIHSYTLTNAWDLSTATYDGNTNGRLDVSAYVSGVYDLAFNSDGTKLFFIDDNGGNQGGVYEYTLTTPYVLSSASYSYYLFLYPYWYGTGSPGGLCFKPGGTKMYVADAGGNRILQFSLSSAFDLSTATYDYISGYFGVGSSGLRFSDTGDKVFTLHTNENVYSWPATKTINTLTLDLSTGSVFSIAPTETAEIRFSNPAASGTVTTATVLYEGNTSSSYDLNNGSYDDKSFSIASLINSPRDIVIKPDGTAFYVVDAGSNDKVYQYSMSTPFDISTASYTSTSFDVSSQDTSPRGLFITSDGDKMFIAGNTNNTVFQYSISTPWTISSASYDSVSYTPSETTSLQKVEFNSDGSKMYIMDSATGRYIYQYSLSTNYVVSSATYDSVSLQTSLQDTGMVEFNFVDNGNKIIAGSGERYHYLYTLTTPYDLSTASYASVVLNGGAQSVRNGAAIATNPSGTKLFSIDEATTQTIYQYSIGSEPVMSYSSNIKFEGNNLSAVIGDTNETPLVYKPANPAFAETDVLIFSTVDGGSSYKGTLAIDGAK